jgi:hypothetical protein
MKDVKMVEYQGKEWKVKELADAFGIKVTTLHNRLYRYGWSVEKAVKTKIEERHGMASRKSSEYNAWCDMKARCNRTSHKWFHRYGGRGITVCERWANSFPNFLSDMGKKPGKEYSLDRIDNDGIYEPGNCRWATRIEQDNNKSDNRFLTYNGRTQTVTQWQRELGLSRGVIEARLDRGFTSKQAIEIPVKPNEIFLIYNGKTQNLTEWANEADISVTCLKKRLSKGWSMGEIIKTPSAKRKILFNGEEKTIGQWAKEYRISRTSINNRLKKGWTFEEALLTPKWGKRNE